MKVYNNLQAISDRFEVFLFDAYGVFWQGNGFYAGSKECMQNLVASGKTVVVVSNSTMLGDDMVSNYAQRGLMPNTDYNYMISSGDLLRYNLQHGNLHFENNPCPQNYFVIGKAHEKAFADTFYQRVDTLEEADFVYCGIPYIFPEDYAKYPQYQSKYLPVKTDESGNICLWDTIITAPFEEIVRKVAELGLPVINANPDFTAREGHKLISDTEASFVIRNGSIAQMLRDFGVEVLEYGKPHHNIYDYTFRFLAQNGLNIDKAKCCMIGDTVRTDIKGAINAGIAPILCVATGVTADEISRGNSLENLCKNENIDIQQIIQIKSVGGL